MKSHEPENRFFDQARETMAWEERRVLLEARFLETLAYAFARSAAFREISAEAGIEAVDVKGLEDLPKLPVLRMADLVERQKKDPPFGGFETFETGRSRRVYVNPGLIWQPGDWDYQDTSWAEALAGAGFMPGDRIINTFNYHLWPFAFMLDDSARMIGATVVPTGVGNTMMQVRIMMMLKINAFVGTPSFLMTLAQRAEGQGFDVKKDLFLERAMVGAEMLPESLRQRLEEMLDMTIRQCYGTVFLGCLGYECGHRTGLHILTTWSWKLWTRSRGSRLSMGPRVRSWPRTSAGPIPSSAWPRATCLSIARNRVPAVGPAPC